MTDKLEKTLLKIYVKNVPVQNTELPKIFAVLVDWYNRIVLTLCFKLVSFFKYIFAVLLSKID